MDGFWKFAIVFVVIGIPVLGGIFYSLAETWMKHRRKMLELQSKLAAEKAAQYAAHVERLEQRVRVLERIATDKGTHIAAEIEDLREDRPN
ncbi:hypothetical protein RCO27_05100 [Sphingosinicella sp. LHD-64]|uniref:hypothetical protein n=1 Tax=Sphingosinicella sp. LHD-64 TaxID=3072139 RepID=UPI00280DD3C1|nr:hypothetical protein [Sphingosinicella sp. LHD-64]MDQ8755599.1 hypothetical protein [Sphingosinicella sp. LHD-64]